LQARQISLTALQGSAQLRHPFLVFGGLTLLIGASFRLALVPLL
jgi:hypothetical protein